MADQLATPQDLASALQLDYTTLSTAQQATMTMLVELATAKVQRAAGGQRILDVTDTALVDVTTLEQWLDVPQYPVRSVTSVVLDGNTLTDWRLVNQRLWRINGWLTSWALPSQVAVTYVHGYPSGSQWLQLGREMTLSLAVMGWGNPGRAVSEAIDDYRVSYAEADARMQPSDYQLQAIAAAYGASAYVTMSM